MTASTTTPASAPAHTAPITVSSRLTRTTVADLLQKVAAGDIPEWAELRVEVPTTDGIVQAAVADIDYARGFLTLIPSDPELPTPAPAYDDIDPECDDSDADDKDSEETDR